MKYLTLVLAVLMLVPAGVWAVQNKKDADSLVLHDCDKHGEFEKLSGVVNSSPKNKMTEKGGFYSFRFTDGFVAVKAVSKKSSALLDASGYNAVSIDVRVGNSKNVPDFANIELQFFQWENKDILWRYLLPRAQVPSNNKWHRVMVPISEFTSGWWGQPKITERNKIHSASIGVVSEQPVDTFDTDVRNLTLWKTPVDEVKVEPLEK